MSYLDYMICFIFKPNGNIFKTNNFVRAKVRHFPPNLLLLAFIAIICDRLAVQSSRQYLFVLSIIFPSDSICLLSLQRFLVILLNFQYIYIYISYEAKYTTFQICKKIKYFFLLKRLYFYYMVLKCVKSKICFFQCFVY